MAGIPSISINPTPFLEGGKGCQILECLDFSGRFGLSSRPPEGKTSGSGVSRGRERALRGSLRHSWRAASFSPQNDIVEMIPTHLSIPLSPLSRGE